MRNVRNALFAVLTLAGVAAYATQSGIEVLHVSGIEVLSVDTHSWGAPPGSTVWAVTDIAGIPVILGIVPVNPLNGNATVIFPVSNPSSRVELRDRTGVLLAEEPLTQFD